MAAPLKETEMRREPLDTGAAPAPETKFNILVVDDRQENLLAFKTILEDLGQNVICVRSGTEALREVLHRNFAVVLLDINMPGMDGYEAAELIRARIASEYTPIIFVTAASPSDMHVRRGYSLGAVDYLFTPVEPEIVRAKVAVFIDMARKTAIIRQQAELLRADAERRAASLETRMQALLNRLEVGVYRSTPEGELLDANPAFLRLLRLGSIHDGTLQLIREVASGKPLPHLLGSQAPANSTTPTADHEVEFPDGTRLWVSLRKTVAAPVSESACVDGVLADISQRKADERLLQESNRALRRSNEDLTQFASAASHDLKEPLRMVATYSELLKQEAGARLGSEGDEFVRFIVEGARRMERLLDDLLLYAQAANLNGDGRIGKVDAGLALDAALLNLHSAVEKSGATVTRGDLPAVAMNESHLIQMLQNLIGNAIKYKGPEKPIVHVSCRRDGDAWRFSVSDNGMGIAPDYHKQIFGVFKRLHGAEYPGTGIGLAICAKTAERYGGRIWVESAPGKGSTFFFDIP
jgi:signal transduction histidine kinase